MSNSYSSIAFGRIDMYTSLVKYPEIPYPLVSDVIWKRDQYQWNIEEVAITEAINDVYHQSCI